MVTIAIPATGERFEAQLAADERGVLRVIEGRSWRADYVLSAVLALGGAWWTPRRSSLAQLAKIAR